MQKTFCKVEAWAIENGMVFDPAKFEATFLLKAKFLQPKDYFAACDNSFHSRKTSDYNTCCQKWAIRWLGVYFDHRMSLADHAWKMAGNGCKAALKLSILVNTTRGIETVIFRKAVHAWILPILTYGVPAWWPEQTRTNCKRQTIQNGMDNNCKKLNNAQNAAMCAILLVWKTTTIAVLWRKAATLPIHHTLDYLCELAALWLHKLEPQHLLRI